MQIEKQHNKAEKRLLNVPSSEIMPAEHKFHQKTNSAIKPENVRPGIKLGDSLIDEQPLSSQREGSVHQSSEEIRSTNGRIQPDFKRDESVQIEEFPTKATVQLRRAMEDPLLGEHILIESIAQSSEKVQIEQRKKAELLVSNHAPRSSIRDDYKILNEEPATHSSTSPRISLVKVGGKINKSSKPTDYKLEEIGRTEIVPSVHDKKLSLPDQRTQNFPTKCSSHCVDVRNTEAHDLASAEIDGKIQERPIILSRENLFVESKGKKHHKNPRSMCSKDSSLVQKERKKNSSVVNIANDAQTVSSKGDKIQEKRTVHNIIPADFVQKETEQSELKGSNCNKNAAPALSRRENDPLTTGRKQAYKNEAKLLDCNESVKYRRRKVVQIGVNPHVSSTDEDHNNNVLEKIDASHNRVVGIEEKQLGIPHTPTPEHREIKLSSPHITRDKYLPKSFSSKKDSIINSNGATVITPIVVSSQVNDNNQVIPRTESIRMPTLELKDAASNLPQQEKVDLVYDQRKYQSESYSFDIVRKEDNPLIGVIPSRVKKNSISVATTNLIKKAELEKKETDSFLSSRSQDVVLEESFSELAECQVLPIGPGQVEDKVSNINHSSRLVLSDLLVDYLSPLEDAAVPRNAPVTVLSHEASTSIPTSRVKENKHTRQPPSDSKYNSTSSIHPPTPDASYASLSTSISQKSSSLGLASGIKSSMATMQGPPPGFLSPITVQPISRGAQSVGSGTSLSTARSIGGYSSESGRYGHQNYQSKKRGHDVSSFTDLNDTGHRNRSDKRTGFFTGRGKETNRGYPDQSQNDRNWHSDRSVSNPPSLGPASTYSTYSTCSSADSFGGSRQGYSSSKQGWNRYGSHDRERSQGSSMGSVVSSQNSRATSGSADYSSSSFAFSEGCPYSRRSSHLSNRSTDFGYDATRYIENNSTETYEIQGSTLQMDQHIPQLDSRSKAAIEGHGTFSIPSMYPEISRSEVSSYPSSSARQHASSNSFALPPPITLTGKDCKTSLDYTTSGEYTTSDHSWDYDGEEEDIMDNEGSPVNRSNLSTINKAKVSPKEKKREWMLRMSRKLADVPVGALDPNEFPISAVMNAWAKTKSSEGASMVEMWLNRVEAEAKAGNSRPGVQPTTKMYTMAVDAWAKSGDGGKAAQYAEAILQQMHQLYQSNPKKYESLKPTTGIFNAVLNSWARSKETIAPVRAEEILNWMDTLYQRGDLDVRPDKYSYNTIIHSHAKRGGKDSAVKAQRILDNMYQMYRAGNHSAKPDTVTYNICINAWAKSGGKGAAMEAENLLSKMHILHDMGEKDVKPNVVTYGAVIDTYAKCMEPGAASRGDTILADMIQRYQSNPSENEDLKPNTHVFNTVINCWSKSRDKDAAYKAEEMLVAMGRLQKSGIPDLKPDAFTYTAVIDAWAKSGNRGSASRAEELFNKMESKYLAGDLNLKPNTFTYNAVINSLAKSGESGAAERAERVLQNMVNRHSAGGVNDVKPTTVNFNAVLDAWAKSRGGRSAAERAEKILEWMDSLYKSGYTSIKPDTITFNACIDTWARSGDPRAPGRAEQILRHMNQLHTAGNIDIKPDSYTYNTVINAWAKSGENGAANKAEHLLSVMEQKYRDGDSSLKPNTRTYTTTIDAWAKSGEPCAAKKAEQILIAMQNMYETTRDATAKPNAHTANAVMNACAFTKIGEDKPGAISIAFRVFEWVLAHKDVHPDAYTFTIMLSVCSNLLPRQDRAARYSHARVLFSKCCEAGYVNDYVLRKLRQTVTEEEFISLVNYKENASVANLPKPWSRNVRQNKQWSKREPRRPTNHNRRKGYQ